MILRVTKYGEPILKQKAAAVESFDEALQTLSADMVETMYDEEGIGLAAPQVNVPLSFCVVDVSPSADAADTCSLDGKDTPVSLLMPLALVNPTFTPMDKDTVGYEEGCLSIPGVNGVVDRPDNISVHYQDLQGAQHTLLCRGILSRCIQHEIDHLQGVLFIDYLSAAERFSLQTKLKKLKRESRDFLKQQK